jgi:hypothetical protein
MHYVTAQQGMLNLSFPNKYQLSPKLHMFIEQVLRNKNMPWLVIFDINICFSKLKTLSSDYVSNKKSVLFKKFGKNITH